MKNSCLREKRRKIFSAEAFCRQVQGKFSFCKKGAPLAFADLILAI